MIRWIYLWGLENGTEPYFEGFHNNTRITAVQWDAASFQEYTVGTINPQFCATGVLNCINMVAPNVELIIPFKNKSSVL